MDAAEPKYPLLAVREETGEVISYRKGKSLPDERVSGDMGEDLQPGAILIDASGRAWDVHGRPMALSGWRRAILKFFKEPDPVELYFVERAPMPFAELLERVCDAVERDGDTWYNQDLMVGEQPDLDLMPIPEQMEILKDQLRQCRDLEQLVVLLGWTNWDERPEQLAKWAAQ